MREKKRTKTAKMHLRQRNNLLYEQLQYMGDRMGGTQFELLVFDKATMHRYTSDQPTILDNIDPKKVCWLCVRGLSDTAKLQPLCAALQIPTLWLQDVLNTHHLSKIEELDTAVLTILDLFSSDAQEQIEKERVGLILKPGLVVSFQETQNDLFVDIANAIANNEGKVRNESADYLYNLLFSNIVNGYLGILDMQREQMLDMENVLMEFGDEKPNDIGRDIQMVRNDYIQLRRNLLPLCENFRILTESAQVKAANKIYYKDTFDHLLQVFQMIDSAKENITALVDLYLANNDLRMNRIMSRLTVLSAIFIPITFLAGVWGMNFRVMPELDWQYGYLLAWGSMLLVAGAIAVWLWRKHWF